jgi:hypothetical protein
MKPHLDGTRRLVGAVGDGAVLFPALHVAGRHGVSRAVAGEVYGEFAIVGCDPYSIVHVESQVGPGEHALSCLDSTVNLSGISC